MSDFYVDLAIYLAINATQRKAITRSELRCSARGCYLASVVSIGGSPFVMGKLLLKGEEGFYTPAPAPRFSLAEIEAMPLNEFLVNWDSRQIARSDLDSAYLEAGLSPNATWKVFTLAELQGSNALVKCAHIGGSLIEDHLRAKTKKLMLSQTDLM